MAGEGTVANGEPLGMCGGRLTAFADARPGLALASAATASAKKTIRGNAPVYALDDWRCHVQGCQPGAGGPQSCGVDEIDLVEHDDVGGAHLNPGELGQVAGHVPALPGIEDGEDGVQHRRAP